MKIKLLSLATIVVAFVVLSSCNGVDKQLTSDIDSFQTQWTSLQTEMNAFQADFKTKSDAMVTECKMSCDSMKSMKMESKDTMGYMKSCETSEQKFTMMNTQMEETKTAMAQETTDFLAWKEKVNKGEIKAEDAKAELMKKQTSLADKTEMLKTWKSAADQVLEECKKACDGMKMMGMDMKMKMDKKKPM